METTGTIGPKVIMITGCNRGIGFGILKNLASRPDKHTFIIAVRTAENGKKTVAELEKTIPKFGERAIIQELDISKTESIDAFAKWLKESGKKVDCLINNAGIAYKGDAFDEEVVRVTFHTDFYGTVGLTEKVLPYISDSGKVIFISAISCCIGMLKSEELKKAFGDPEITKEKLFGLAKQFHEAVKDGTYLDKGWVKQAYNTSYLCLNIYARILGRDSDIIKRGIQIHACSPGWVQTDMSSKTGPRTIDQGAVCPSNTVYFPWKIDPKLQGQVLYNCKVVDIAGFIPEEKTPPGSPKAK